MIGYLEGTLFLKLPHYIVVLINGVGYQIEVSLSTFTDLPLPGEKVQLHVYTYLKENLLKLYGFFSQEEKNLFAMLIGVSGIGPKLALNVLSRISPDEFEDVITKGDISRIKAIPGIGHKMAQRVLLELKDKWKPEKTKLAKEGKIDNILWENALSALLNLGYQKQEAVKALQKALKQFSAPPSLEVLIKEVLRQL
jgi:Holliday junction DNA helicase RuvA